MSQNYVKLQTNRNWFLKKMEQVLRWWQFWSTVKYLNFLSYLFLQKIICFGLSCLLQNLCWAVLNITITLNLKKFTKYSDVVPLIRTYFIVIPKAYFAKYVDIDFWLGKLSCFRFCLHLIDDLGSFINLPKVPLWENRIQSSSSHTKPQVLKWHLKVQLPPNISLSRQDD